jgi:hypothetical protein
MFGLKPVVDLEADGVVHWTELSFGGESFGGFEFAGTTFVAAFVAGTVETDSAGSDTLRGLDELTLVAEGCVNGLRAAAEDFYPAQTGAAVAGVAGFCAGVTTGEGFAAGLLTTGDGGFAVGPRGFEQER